MGSRQATLTDIDLDEFELLRKQLQELAARAREMQAELQYTQLPQLEAARIEHWQSIAKLAYHLSLGAVMADAWLIAEGCGLTAATYDGLDWVLEQEKRLQFPWA